MPTWMRYLSLFIAAVTTFSAARPATSPAETCPPYLRYQSLSAHERCTFPNYFLPEQLAVFRTVDPSQQDNPDLNTTYIMQTPRYAYDDPVKNQHAPGDPVTFTVHVANRGSEPTGPYGYEWSIDGSPVLSGSASSLEPAETTTFDLAWTWQSGNHTLRFEVDPDGLIVEVSELNNAIEDRTNALSVGFWVEQSVYDWFNANQVLLGLGSVSWEDWAQRQLRVWNEMFEDAVTPLTPDGILDRVRLDKVTVVPDGALPPCATNFPDPDDRTIDLEWGFPSEEVGVPSGHICGHFNLYLDHPEALNVEYSLMHELSHARYLIDLYGLNVYVSAATLSADASSAASTLVVDRDVESDTNFAVPVPLAVGGELIVCNGKSANTFIDCERGAEGTTPRQQPAGTLVNLAAVRLQDGQGNLVQGSDALPLIGWNDHLYYSHYPDDMMNGGLVYREHSAYAWNRIVGQRPVCGNFNAPCNIGEYLDDMPGDNRLEIRNPAGLPIPGVRVELFRARPFPSIYGKVYYSSPDLIRYTDALGQATLGSFPFGDGVSHVETSNGTVLLKLSSANESVYRFLEVTEANVAFWAGDTERAIYPVTADLQAGVPPSQYFLPLVSKSFSPPEILLDLPFEGSFMGKDGEVGDATGVTFVTGYDGQGILVDDSDTLSYETTSNIAIDQGALELWVKPLWNGNDAQHHYFFSMGDSYWNRLELVKDGGNYLKFEIYDGAAGYGVGVNVSDWSANTWYHLAVTWQPNEMRLYIDGVAVGSNTSVNMMSNTPTSMYIGSSYQGLDQVDAVIDELRISDAPRPGNIDKYRFWPSGIGIGRHLVSVR